MELEPAFCGDLVASDGVSNSSLWSRLLLLRRSIVAWNRVVK